MSRAFLVLAIAMVTGIRGAGSGQASRALLLNPDDPEWTKAAPARSTVVFETSKGRIVFEMRREWAPHGVDRFYTQARLHRAGDNTLGGIAQPLSIGDSDHRSRVMTEELANIDLLKSGSDEHGSLAPRRRLLAIVAFLVIAILLLGGAYFWLRRGRSETATTPATQPTDPAVKVRQDQAELISLPPLDQTDPLVRQLVGALSSHPVVASWLTTDRLISNFVVVTSKIADGQSPAGELKAIGPVPPFKVRSVKGTLSVDPSSYHRYDRYAQAVSALDAQGAARLYETLKPRINEADRNFGGSGQFDAEMQRAIDELLKVPVVEGEVALRMSGIGYAYADPRLEGLSPPQKQLLRMGPENVKAIQAKLREIASFLQLSVPSR